MRDVPANIPEPLASTANRLELYERSVQDPPQDVKYLTQFFTTLRQREPMSLREDFCGTAALSAAWVASHPERTAVGVDNSAPTLEWAREHRLKALGDAASRVTLLEQDVRDPTQGGPFDLIYAGNFSFCCFHTRKTLLAYFSSVRDFLGDEGVFLLDIYGGPCAQQVEAEETEHDDFTYIWDQASYDPLTARTVTHIHFRFPDGSVIHRAFTYDWRLWALPELIDILEDAGFKKTTVFWEGCDDEGDGNGEFTAVDTVENEDAWIAYVAAEG